MKNFKIKTMNKLLFWTVTVYMCATAPVFGYSVDLQDMGSNTLDSETGLLWLDWTETAEMSWTDLQASDWLTQGYRMATYEELFDFYTKLELPEWTTDKAFIDEFGDAFSLVGRIWEFESYNPYTSTREYQAITAASTVTLLSGQVQRTYVEITEASLLPDFAPPAYIGTSALWTVLPGDYFPYGGWALVKDNSMATVPEPSTMLLLGTGIAYLAGASRIRRQK